MDTASRGAIVITGASTGIGAACAVHLTNLGFRVFAGVRKPGDGEALRAKAGDALTPLRIDVTDAASIASAAETVTRELGDQGLAGLVNNAGISVNGPLEFLPIEDIRHQLDVNVLGQIAVTQAFLPLIRKRPGRIVYIGSIAGKLAVPLGGPYSASKFALEAVADSLRLELIPWGIEVSLVEPGAIATPIWGKSLKAADARLDALPPHTSDLYGPTITAVKKVAQHAASIAVPPEHVARAVEHALTAPRPRTRYIVGRDARIQRWVARLPDRLRDRLLLKFLGLRP